MPENNFIYNDRYILANGAVSANAPLSGDGSNSQPLGLDLKTDNSLSGNGALTSPLGVNVGNSWIDVTDEFSATTALSPSYLKVTYNPYLGMVQLGGSYYCTPTAQVTLYTAPKKYKPINTMEYKEGSRYYDILTSTDTSNFIRARTGTTQWVSLNLVYACNNTATN